MTVEEKAQALIEMASVDEEALRSWSEIEDATFEAYANEYLIGDLLVCKGCHGG